MTGSDRGCVKTLNRARHTTNCLVSDFLAGEKAPVEATTPTLERCTKRFHTASVGSRREIVSSLHRNEKPLFDHPVSAKQ